MKDGTCALIFDLWAKTDPRHPLPCHMIDVGCVASALLASGPYGGTQWRFQEATGCSAEQVAPWLAYLTSLHDLGKCHAEFQAKGGPELTRGLVTAGIECTRTVRTFRHEAFGATWVMGHLMDTLGWARTAAATVSAAVRGHHGNFMADDAVESTARADRWRPLRAELERAMRATFEPPEWNTPVFRDHSAAGLLLSGLIVLSDWIASNPELFLPAWRGESLQEYADASRRQAQRAIRQIGMDKVALPGVSVDFRNLWPNIPSLRPVQTAVQQAVEGGIAPGLTIIEAPMGEGKTEAAIYLASQWISAGEASGMYVALPTAATSNQMFGRVREFLGQHDEIAAEEMQLVHGASWLLDRATPDLAPALSDEGDPQAGERALDWFRPRKRSLLGAFGVGTVDQAEMSVLNVKHGFLRLYGLAHKVLVVDEVHAYDAYQTQIVRRLLEWCRALAIPVILLSATLPRKRKEILIGAYAAHAELPQETQEYPLITHVARDGTVQILSVSGASKQVSLNLHLHAGLLEDPAGTARLVAQRVLTAGGCHVVIANTVGSAQAIYRELAHAMSSVRDVDLRLFHARFPAGRRQELEREVLALYDKGSLERNDRRPARAVLVATQVVEQSLDLDFDEMYSQVAPIDLLLQRSGRLHRHDRPLRPTGPQPTLHVLLPSDGSTDFGPTGRVYHPYILIRTLRRLQSGGGWQLPGDMRDLVEGVYGESAQHNPDLALLEEGWREQGRGDANKARQYLIPEPYERGFKLAHMPTGAFAEDDGQVHTYFTAQTRVGDESVRVALMEGDEMDATLLLSHAPSRDILEGILLRTVSLPAWWLRGATPCEGFTPGEDGPPWLSGAKILRLQDGRWRASTSNKVFELTLDPLYGMMRREEGA